MHVWVGGVIVSLDAHACVFCSLNSVPFGLFMRVQMEEYTPSKPTRTITVVVQKSGFIHNT